MSYESLPRKLWEHPSPELTNMGQFRRALEANTSRSFLSFDDLYQFSVDHRVHFWDFCWKYFRLIHEGTYTTVVNEKARMDSIPRWFEGVHLNFAENVLFSSLQDTDIKEDGKVAVVEIREGASDQPIRVTWGEIRRRTGRLIQAMKAHGVVKGDRVAVCASNSIDTLLVFLATTAIGAIFSSSSTDMGVKGVLDRLLQIRPRWLFMDDTAVYNGKTIDLLPKIADIVEGMQSVDEFQGVVCQPRFALQPADLGLIPKTQSLARFLQDATSSCLEFERVAFSDPLLIAYSSGTSGQPKCIVHSVGGALLTAHKEGGLHQELDKDSIVLQYTTTGWIMYLSLLQALLLGARVILYDGSPFTPKITSFIRLASIEQVTHFGISPQFLEELRRSLVNPRDRYDLSSLKIVTSTGMVLPDSLFNWFYDAGFPPHVRLNNISGGTDIAGSFGIGNSLLPVYVGGCAGRSLGIPVKVFDSTIEGEGVKGVPVEDGVPGELVATKAFPNMPVGFWGQTGEKLYYEAYFARFDDVWTHGDFVSLHPITKQLLFHGRSDGVLNPSGVRFGSSEIYQIIDEDFSNEVLDSLCVGQRRPSDVDERLVSRVNSAIRQKLSARHVPSFIFETPEIPTTVNYKKVELPVKRIVSGSRVKPSGTLINPASLKFYYQFAEVEKLVLKEPKHSKL
ncbi:acetoacetate-CoA ligase [Aspergillus bertholletiae]|uniref:Acetoacetate-CoA ligase n=1 Tax=Aspergillus bertholletiae TaxID=1226010 RepID=A0A5N7B8W8_9EURO|nr:acetoacetate-CoA ligase [Aspergillus bertholletiae]